LHRSLHFHKLPFTRSPFYGWRMKINFMYSRDAVEYAEQLYVEQIRSSLLYRPEPSAGGTSSNHMASLIYPVVGVSQQSHSKLISDIISHFNEESDRVNLSSIRGYEIDIGSSSTEGATSNDLSTMSHLEKYRSEYQNLLRRYGSLDADGHLIANDTELPAQEGQSKPVEPAQSRLSTSSSMMSINSNSSGSLEDLDLDNSNSF
jgi:hypothetical protein